MIRVVIAFVLVILTAQCGRSQTTDGKNPPFVNDHSYSQTLTSSGEYWAEHERDSFSHLSMDYPLRKELSSLHPLPPPDRIHSPVTLLPPETTDQVVSEYQEWACTTGIWIPSGHLSLVGPRPTIGFMFSHWHYRFLFDFMGDYRFGGAAQPYQVMYKGKLQTTQSYTGAFIGCDVGYAFLSSPFSTVYAMCGFGFDEFDSIQDPNDQDSVIFHSINLNAGLGYKHFTKKGRMFGIEILQNKSPFENPGGTPIDGDAVSVRLLFGWVE